MILSSVQFCVINGWSALLSSFYVFDFIGVLRTAMTLDREMQQEYLLVATATDGGGLSCVTEVRIFLRDVNDNPPEFTGNFRDTLTVQEDARVNTLLTRVTTVDRDTGQLRFVDICH